MCEATEPVETVPADPPENQSGGSTTTVEPDDESMSIDPPEGYGGGGL